jgi:uncharacterized OsmC-like protein
LSHASAGDALLSTCRRGQAYDEIDLPKSMLPLWFVPRMAMAKRGRLPVDPDWLRPVTLRLAATCSGEARSDVRVRDHCVTIDEPPERLGTDRGPAPTEMQIATLIGATQVILQRLARRDNCKIRRLDITAEADLDRRGVWLTEPLACPWIEIRLRIAIDTSAEDALLSIWRDDLRRFSPIHAVLLSAGAPIAETWIRTHQAEQGN